MLSWSVLQRVGKVTITSVMSGELVTVGWVGDVNDKRMRPAACLVRESIALHDPLEQTTMWTW